MAKRKQYDDKFRASAVVMLEAAGYPERDGAVTAVANATGVPRTTLRRWYRGTNNPPPDELVHKTKSDLKVLLRAEIEAALYAMPAAREDATYRELGTVIGILTDKLQLLEGKATERLEINELSDEERAARIAGLLGAARARRDGRASDDHAGGSE